MPSRTVLLRNTFRERARFIPLRLSAEERRLLALLEAALSVSQYTDKVAPPLMISLEDGLRPIFIP